MVILRCHRFGTFLKKLISIVTYVSINSQLQNCPGCATEGLQRRFLIFKYLRRQHKTVCRLQHVACELWVGFIGVF